MRAERLNQEHDNQKSDGDADNIISDIRNGDRDATDRGGDRDGGTDTTQRKG